MVDVFTYWPDGKPVPKGWKAAAERKVQDRERSSDDLGGTGVVRAGDKCLTKYLGNIVVAEVLECRLASQRAKLRIMVQGKPKEVWRGKKEMGPFVAAQSTSVNDAQ